MKEKIIEELHRQGYRMTDQRRVLIDIIVSGEVGSSKEIYYEAKKKIPGIGMATVHRMISTLEDTGLISMKNRYKLEC